MYIVGFSSLNSTPSESYQHIKNLNKTIIKNGTFDDLFITGQTNGELTPNVWDDKTILHYDGNDSLDAGNLPYLVSQTDVILLKRRRVGTHKWITLLYKSIYEEDDFRFTYIDRFCKNNHEYEYALVPCVNGTESEYSITTIKSEFKGLVISDDVTTYRTICDPVVNNRERVIPTANVITTLSGSYPYIINNNNLNYDVVDISFSLYEFDNKCMINLFDSVEYRTIFLGFLANKKPKIIKTEDGRVWVASINNNPKESTKSQNQMYVTTVSISFTEIGDSESTRSLYDNGLVDLEEWMVTN